jgi:Flp pilus assembly protein TadG
VLTKRVVRTIRRRMVGRVGDSRGAALVELAVALPLLIVVLLGTIDFGRVFRSAMIVTNAARAGALYGAQDVSLSGDTAGMIAAANAVLTANGLTVGPAPTATTLCQCVTDLGVYSPTSPVNTCTATCSGAHMAVSVTVSVTRTFSTLASFPGLPNTVTFTRMSTARAK